MTTDSSVREKIEAFLAEPRNMMLAAIRKDGRPQMTPVWFYWDGARFYVSTTRSRAKYANLRRDPRAQIAIDEPKGHRFVILNAAAEIWTDHTRALPFYRQIRQKHGMPPADDGTMIAGLEREGRVLVVLTPEKPMAEWNVLMP